MKTEKDYSPKLQQDTEEFLFFRYEMNWMFRKDEIVKAAKKDKKKSLPTMGILGDTITRSDTTQRQNIEKYRPPGLVSSTKGINPEILKYVGNCEPCDMLFYVKNKEKEKISEKSFKKNEEEKVEGLYDKAQIPQDWNKLMLPSDMPGAKGGNIGKEIKEEKEALAKVRVHIFIL